MAAGRTADVGQVAKTRADRMMTTHLLRLCAYGLHARGVGNAEIAHRLGVRRHTARHLVSMGAWLVVHYLRKRRRRLLRPVLVDVTLAGANDSRSAHVLYNFLHGRSSIATRFDRWCAVIGSLPRKGVQRLLPSPGPQLTLGHD